MRIGGVILGVATLLRGFLQAPFDHIHPGEDFERESSSAPVHLHAHEFAGQGAGIAAYTSPDDNEIDVLWSAAPSANVQLFLVVAELGERLPIHAPSVASAAILVPRHRGHDPPESSPKIPRAPPA